MVCRSLSSVLVTLLAGLAHAAPLDTAALDDAMAKAFREAEVCFSDAAGSRSVVGGEVGIRAIVGPDGTILDAQVTGGTVRDEDVLACVTSAVKRQRIARPQGGGFTPMTRTFVFWSPPEGARPVKVGQARRAVQAGLPTLETCLAGTGDLPDRLDVQLLVAGRRAHVITGGLPSAWGTCVGRAFRDTRLSGVGAVLAQLTFDDEGVAAIDAVEARSGDSGEVQTWSGSLRTDRSAEQ